jgi:hypothetical protein
MASRTEFQTRPRRDAPNGHMVVYQALEFLRDVVDKIRNNISVGSATILAGNTTVDVALSSSAGFSSVPALDVTPTTDPGAGMRFWVSNKTTSGFRINLSAAAPIGGLSFDYQAVVNT